MQQREDVFNVFGVPIQPLVDVGEAAVHLVERLVWAATGGRGTKLQRATPKITRMLRDTVRCLDGSARHWRRRLLLTGDSSMG